MENQEAMANLEGDKAVQAVQTNKVDTVHLSKQLTTEQETAFVQALGTNTALLALFLPPIGNGFVKALATALKDNNALNTLALGFSDLGDDGALAFADMLATNSSINFLGLGIHRVADRYIETIAAGLEKNKVPDIVCVFDKGTRGANAICSVLEKKSYDCRAMTGQGYRDYRCVNVAKLGTLTGDIVFASNLADEINGGANAGTNQGVAGSGARTELTPAVRRNQRRQRGGPSRR